MAARNELAGPSALFLGYLEDLPLRTWLAAVGTRPPPWKQPDPRAAALTEALKTIDPAVVFQVRDGVLHALARFETVEGRRLTDGFVAARHLRPTTERSALAVLARGALTPEDFAVLYGPFETIIPAALLFGIG